MTGKAGVAAIVCADWSKDPRKRAVYVADVAARVVRRLGSHDGWSLKNVLAASQKWTADGAVLATFDVPLGVPASYLAALGHSGGAPPTFLTLLERSRLMPRFFGPTSVARDWAVDRPFFAVPGGEGGLGSYTTAAAASGVTLLRQIDRITGAKPAFVTSGIPGSVGSAACSLWQELAVLLAAPRNFKVWPFEGEIDELLKSPQVVVGEIYPRAAYATALLDVPPPARPALIVAKTDFETRRQAIGVLRRARWVASLGITFDDLDHVEGGEDDFDACVTAAALLRCVLEESPLCPSQLEASNAEGGILGTGSVNLRLAQKTFQLDRGRSTGTVAEPQAMVRRIPGPSPSRPRIGNSPIYRCPIEGCQKTFVGSRGGWDAHVASARIHPAWYPKIASAEERKRRFQAEFPGFFGS